MSNIRDFSQKELDIIKTHQALENSIFRKYGLELLMMSFLSISLIGLFLEEHNINIFFGHGISLSFGIIFYLLFKNFYSLYKIISLENLFIEAFSQRTGFDIIKLDSLGDEYPHPQILDKKTNTYYTLFLRNGGVGINSLKSI